MSDAILIDGDVVTFVSLFGAASVVVQPGKLVASGPATINGKKVCVEGDEASVEVPGCAYVTPVYSIAGTGTLTIKALAGDQLAKKTRSGDTPVMLKGSQFDAVFTVDSPAKQPPPGASPPQSDTTKEYSGNGTFAASNAIFTGA